MRLVSCWICTVLLAVPLVPWTARGQTELAAQSTMKFLSIPVGARAAGMGYSFLHNGDDLGIAFWNPAGVATLKGTRVFFDVNYWISDIRQYSAAISNDFGDIGVVFLTFTTMDYGEIHGTIVDRVAASSGSMDYVETGNVNVANYVLAVGYARAISDRFSVGGQMKYAYAGLGSNTIVQGDASEEVENNLGAIAFDLGTRYNTGFKDLTFGMSIRNFSREVNYARMSQGYYLPLVFSVGFSMNILALLVPEETEHVVVLSATGLHPNDFSERANVGLEYAFQNTLFVRAGYKFNYSIETVSAGAGLRMSVGEPDNIVQFDYAYVPMKFFGGVHRFSLSTAF